MVAFLRHSIPTAVLVSDPDSLPNHRAIAPAKDAEGVWIDGVPHLITSELKTWSTLSNVEPISIPGYWFGKKGTSHVPTSPVQPGERVFIFFHGGGYTVGCAHPATDALANIPRALIELSSHVPRCLAVEYRLSSTHPLPDRHPFPAALLDALAGYSYLVNVIGYSPRDIIAVGNSAGGNLALALVPPGGLLLLSPWTDLSDSHDTPVIWLMALSHSIASEHFSDLTASKWPPTTPTFRRHPCILPVQARFTGFPRTFIAAGGAEMFLDQIRTLRDKMVADVGAEMVTYYEATDAIHDWLVFPWVPAYPATLIAIQQWLT
ncbi:Alpha/Beta hydrolase protein [Pisolithus marmoratus]|nr:Alpha/Beta hydrolase protein [Pisolithus marmoratus]